MEVAGDRFDFSSLEANLATLKGLCADFHEKARGGTEVEQYEATKTCLQLARILVPTLYTQTQPTDHQAALGTRFLADLQESLNLPALDPESWAYKFTQTTLMRKLNKVNHAVIMASRLLASALDK